MRQVIGKSVNGLHKQHRCPENLSELGSISKSNYGEKIYSPFEAGCRLERTRSIHAFSEVSLSILTAPESQENSANANLPQVKKHEAIVFPEDFLKEIQGEDVPRKPAARNFSCRERVFIWSLILLIVILCVVSTILLLKFYHSSSKDDHKAPKDEPTSKHELKSYIIYTHGGLKDEATALSFYHHLLQQVVDRNSPPRPIQGYRWNIISFFVANLTKEEASKMAGLKGVITVVPNGVMYPISTRF